MKKFYSFILIFYILLVCSISEAGIASSSSYFNLVDTNSLTVNNSLTSPNSYFNLVDTNSLTVNNSLTSPKYSLGNRVNIRKYGNLESALTAIGSTPTVLEWDANIALAADANCPETLDIDVVNGGVITHGNYNLAVHGDFMCPPKYKGISYTGTGRMTLSKGSISEAHPEWFGETPDDSSDNDSTYLDYCATAAGEGAIIRLANGQHDISSQFHPLSYQRILGTKGTKIQLKAATDLTAISMTAKTGVTIDGIELYGNPNEQTTHPWYGIYIGGNSRDCEVSNCYVHGFYSSGNDCSDIIIMDSNNNHVHDCLLGKANNNLIIQRGSYNRVENCHFEDNLISEALSIYRPYSATIKSEFNTVTNCTFNNCRTGIMIQYSSYNTVSNCTVNNYTGSGVGLIIRNGGNIVNNINIKMGSDTEFYAVSLEQLEDNDLPMIISNVLVDVNGKNEKGFNIWASSPRKIILNNCAVYNSGIPQTDSNCYGVSIGDSKNVIFNNFSVDHINGYGFYFGAGCKDISLNNCIAEYCGLDGVYFSANAVENIQIIGGTYKNNGQLLADTYRGITSGTGNIKITLNDAHIYDDQNSPTQKLAGVYLPESSNFMPVDSSPSSGFWRLGEKSWKYSTANEANPGWVVTNRVDTYMKAVGDPNIYSIDVDSTSGMASTDVVGIKLDNGNYHWTTITTVTDGDTLLLTVAIPTARHAYIDQRVITYRWAKIGKIGTNEVYWILNSTTATQTNGTGEDILKSTSISAGSLSTDRGLKITAFGTKIGANDTKTIKLYFGTDNWTVHAAANNTNDWRVVAEIINTSATTQIISWTCWDGATITQGYEEGTQDTTSAQTLKFTGECVHASDTITQKYMLIEKLK